MGGETANLVVKVGQHASLQGAVILGVAFGTGPGLRRVFQKDIPYVRFPSKVSLRTHHMPTLLTILVS